MSKFKKVPEKLPEKKKKEISDEQFAFKTIILSTVFSSIFLLLSILFNGGIITFFMDRDLTWDIIDVSIKVGIILLFYFFTMISIGNYKELVGKPVSTKEITYIFLLALVQSCLHLYVFLFTLFGLIIILAYLFLVQER